MSLERAKALREERATLAKQADDLLKRAKDEKRDLSEDEAAQFDKIHDDCEAKLSEAKRLERHHDLQQSLDDPQPTLAGGQQRANGPDGGQSDDVIERFRTWLRNDEGNQPKVISLAGMLPGDSDYQPRLRTLRHELQLRQAGMSEREARALAVGTTAAGGATVAQEFYNVLETAMLQFGGARQVRSTIMRTATGASMPMPQADDTGNIGELLGENTGAGEQDINFTQAQLDAYKYSSKSVKVSIELLQDSAFNLATWLGERLGERIGRITNQHFTTGDGSGKPQGFVTGAPEGFTSANTDAIHVDADEDDLLELFHSVDPSYRMNAEWTFNDGTLKEIKKLKDADNRPLWVPGIAVREPDSIHGKPYVINQDMPDLGAGNKPIVFGDFSRFIIRDVMDVMLMRLEELYAESGQVAFIAFSRHDSVLNDAGTGPIKSFNNSDS